MTKYIFRRDARSAISSPLSLRRVPVVHPEAPGETTLVVDDVDGWVERCWDAGLTVRVHDGETGVASATVIDRNGRRVRVVARSAQRQQRPAASEERA